MAEQTIESSKTQTELKLNLGYLILEQMNDHMKLMSQAKYEFNYTLWFKAYEELHTKVIPSLKILAEKTKGNKNTHQELMEKLEEQYQEYRKLLRTYQDKKANNTITPELKIKIQRNLFDLQHQIQPDIFYAMAVIKAWIPTKTSYGSWEDEFNADFD